MITLFVVFEEDVLRLICGHALQSGRCLEEKYTFYDEFKCVWNMHSADDLVMCLGDINGYIGRDIYSIGGVHGGYGAGRIRRKNVIRILSGEGIICVKNMV